MNAALATIACLVVYALGYRFYAGHLARNVFSLTADAETPAHTLRDDVDYVPTNPWVLFGHHWRACLPPPRCACSRSWSGAG